MRIPRVITGIAAAVLLVAGCGTTEDPSRGDAVADGGQPITVVDSRGKAVELDGPAKRVAATEWNGVEELVSLGVMPVGVADPEGYEQWVSAAPLDDSVRDIGTRGEPSIDAISSLGLDLVVVTAGLPEGALRQIESRVPVLVIEGGNAADPIGSLFSDVGMIAKATGTEPAAAALRAEFDDGLAAAKAEVERLGAAGDQVAFSDAYVNSGSVTIRPFTEGSLVSAVFERIGLRNPWPMQGDPRYGLGQTDVEGLTRLPDVRFWYLANGSLGDPYAEVLADNAIWRGLPFVQRGAVHRFPDGLWMFGGPKSMVQYADAAVDALRG
ncbi:iron-siderophore ABC transporter substrate-binding protein [Saccharopolyspora cebuensis]|uniref:Iron-siderophore ABC transporter substrate-binding protein n=1 Tax=Saccharopolyspora cebuensis TaxID=418759 RepID=A0ABV4CG65_9PSEU